MRSDVLTKSQSIRKKPGYQIRDRLAIIDILFSIFFFHFFSRKKTKQLMTGVKQ